MKIILTIKGDGLNERKRTFEPNGEYVEYSIGRNVDADCYVGDRRVSKRHCILIYDEGELKIMDMQSANGTVVDGNPLGGDPAGSRKLMMQQESTVHIDPDDAAWSSVAEAIIRDGSVVEIGGTEIKINLDEGQPAPARHPLNDEARIRCLELVELFKRIDADNPLFPQRDSLVRAVEQIVVELDANQRPEVSRHG